jgi:tryptophan synthase alpha subunit
VGSYADAVIVGSALVAALGEKGEQGVRELTAHLKTGLP